MLDSNISKLLSISLVNDIDDPHLRLDINPDTVELLEQIIQLAYKTSANSLYNYWGDLVVTRNGLDCYQEKSYNAAKSNNRVVITWAVVAKKLRVSILSHLLPRVLKLHIEELLELKFEQHQQFKNHVRLNLTTKDEADILWSLIKDRLDYVDELTAIQSELQTADEEDTMWLMQRLGELGPKAAPVLREIIESNNNARIFGAASYYLIKILN